MINSLRNIKDFYYVFVFDVWGTIHDGSHVYDYAKETIENLKKSGKKVVLVTNNPREIDFNIKRLEELGLGADKYDFLVTAGHRFFTDLREEKTDFKAFVLDIEPFHKWFENSYVKIVDTISNADVIISLAIDKTLLDGNAKPTPSDPPEPEAIRVLKPINSPASFMIAPPELPRLIAASV